MNMFIYLLSGIGALFAIVLIVALLLALSYAVYGSVWTSSKWYWRSSEKTDSIVYLCILLVVTIFFICLAYSLYPVFISACACGCLG